MQVFLVISFSFCMLLCACQDLGQVSRQGDESEAPSSIELSDEDFDSTFEQYFTTDHILSSEEVKAYIDIPYGEAGKQKLDLFIPKSNDEAEVPLIIYIHGGGFVGGKKERQYGKAHLAKEFQSLLDEGYALANVGYRLLEAGENTGVAKCIGDCQRAITELYHHADELGLDKSKMVLRGHSAGASIALWIGLYDGSTMIASDEDYPLTGEEFKALVLNGVQGSLDLFQWETVFADHDLKLDDVMNEEFTARAFALYGLPHQSTWDRAEFEQQSADYRLLLDPRCHLDSDDPRIFVDNKASLTGPPANRNLLFHHALHAAYLESLSADVSGEYHRENRFVYEENAQLNERIEFIKKSLTPFE